MSFLTGALSGYAGEATDMQKGGKKGLLRRKKKQDKVAVASSGDDSGTVPVGMEFKRGGRVRKTGIAKVHKGEQVLTKKQAKRYRARGGSKR